MKALYRLYSAYPLLLRWKRRGAAAAPTPGFFDYLRPDGTSYYRRPDGTSYYTRP